MLKLFFFIILNLTSSILLYGQASSTSSSADTSLIKNDTLTKPLSEVVINENRLQIPFKEQNRNIQIIDRSQIEQLPARSIHEVLAFVSGVDVRQRGPWGGQADINIDGGTFEQTMILLNGMKVSDPQTAHNSTNLPVPLESIERIEVIRGPAARIYGINSLTGAINIVTRKPQTSGVEGGIVVGSSFLPRENDEGGLYSGKSAHFGGRVVGDKNTHLIYTSHHSGNGYRYNTAFHNNKLFYQGDMQLTSDDDLNISGGYTYNKFGANGFYAAPVDREAEEHVQTALAALSYKRQMNQRMIISPRIIYRFGHDDYRFFRNDLSRSRNLHSTHVINSDVNGNYKSNIGTFGLGLEMRNEVVKSTNLGDHKRNNYGAYGEFRKDDWERLSLSLGAYVNYNSDFGWRVYPGLDLGYLFYDKWKFFINTGAGQRIPSFTDLYYVSEGNIGNPLLTSEDAWFAETGLKFNNERWSIHGSYFFRTIYDFIDWTRFSINEPWYPENFLQNRTHGLSFSGKFFMNPGGSDFKWFTGLAYTYLQPTFIQYDGDGRLSRYAIENLRHQLVANVVMHYRNFSISLTERFVERISYKKYHLVDGRIAYQKRKFRYFAESNNVFDVVYIEAGAVPMPGRWFNTGISFSI